MTTSDSNPGTITATSSLPPSRFDVLVGAFAQKVGIAFDDVRRILLEKAVETPDDVALSILGSASDMDDATWKDLFSGVKLPVLKNAVAALRTAVNPPTVAMPPAPPSVSPIGLPTAQAGGFPGAGLGGPMFALKQPIDDSSLLSALVTGGRLNGTVTPTDASMAVKVLMGSSIGLYEVAEKLVDRIENASNAAETPADASLYDLIDSINAREYAPILKALGAPLRAVGANERKKFLAKVRDTLIPGLRRFQAQLAAWYESYKLERSDPSLLIGAITGQMGGLMPVSMTDTSALRSAAADLMTMTNKLFAGMTAIPVARAMAADAVQILTQLNDPKYIAAAGFTTRDEMLRTLGVSVTEQFARNEKTLTTYILNAMSIPEVTDAQLPMLAQHLYILGASVDWEALGTPRVAETMTANPAARGKNREDVNGRTDANGRWRPFPDVGD